MFIAAAVRRKALVVHVARARLLSVQQLLHLWLDENFNVLFGWSDNTVIPEYELLYVLGDCIEDEWQRYLKEVEINFRKDDPLMWQKCREKSFPIILRLARKYLAIPVSTAPSERVFQQPKIYCRKKDGGFYQIGSVNA